MPQLTTTPRIAAALARYNTLPSTTTPLPTTPSLPHSTLLHIARALHIPPSHLLAGSTLYRPPPPAPPPKSPEYEALMARLRAEEAQRAYRAMAASKLPEELDEEMTWREVKSQVTAIFNVLVTTLACAVAVWRVAAGWGPPERLALAFLAGLVVLVAEVVLFWGFVRRVGEGGKGRGRGKEEGERVVRRWEVGVGGVREVEEVGVEKEGKAE